MAELDELARRLAAVAAEARRASARSDQLELHAEAFGADGPGRLGDVGRALAGQHRVAIDDRRAEARRVETVADELAAAVERAAAGYRDLEARRTAPR